MSGRLLLLGIQASVESITAKPENISRTIETMKENIEKNPPIAIGLAKDFVEAFCKDILTKNSSFTEEKINSFNFPKLKKETLKSLKLVPEGIAEQNKTNEIVKKILGNLSDMASNIGELRNIHGSGHGRSSRHQSLKPRHAQLAVDSAITFVNFISKREEALERARTEG